ncbi:MAG: sensor domain-containing diguanylate cyclase [Thiohalocapsa sp.]|nr:sensor domain-containing diguanylate cyclase [Thiohalocapsa sp.]MCF7992774.1 sensor domain-containing diguanylate cyclase [Thiohalocapsa sp.]
MVESRHDSAKVRRAHLWLENLPTAVSVSCLGHERRILFGNREFKRTFGDVTHELPTLTAWAEQACPDECDRADTLAWWDAASSGAGAADRMRPKRLLVTCKDGIPRDMLLSANVADDTLITTFVDLGERHPPACTDNGDAPDPGPARQRRREAERASILRDMLHDAPLSSLCKRIVQATEAEDPDSLCSILLLDDDGKHLSVLAAPSLPAVYNAAVDGVVIGEGQGSCGTAAARGELVVVEDIDSHPAWRAYRTAAARAGLRACWSHPVLSPDGQVLATFAIYYREPRAPSASEIELIQAAADLTALAIERTRHRSALSYRTEFEKTVRDISSAFLSQTVAGLDDAMQYAMERIGSCAKANRCYLFLLSDDGTTMNCTHEWCAPGVLAQIDDLRGLEVGKYPWLAEIARSGSTAKITEKDFHLLSPQERRAFAEGDIRSMLAVPMFGSVSGAMKGLLGLDDVASVDRWGEFEWRLLRVATDIISSALARHALEQRLLFEARHDALTGIANRRAFGENLLMELERSARYRKESCLLLIDVDHFKPINDSHGHDVGDQVLQALVDVLAARLRKSDILARWGGEEFALLLPDTDTRGANLVAEALRNAVIAARFPGIGHITVSVGGTCLRAGDSMQTLFRRVDEALYAAKNQGRNCCVMR